MTRVNQLDPLQSPVPGESPSLSVLIVDDHELVRAGMRRLLEDTDSIGNFTEAASGEIALELASRQHFDIILMDLSMPGMSGVEASLMLMRHHPRSRIIVITAAMENTYTRRLIDKGVRGYLTKDSSADEMRSAIARVMQGDIYLSPAIATRMAIEGVEESSQSPFDLLTDREMQIALMLLGGKRNCQIGESLFISEKTVSTHRTRAFAKLGISNTAELARLAMRYGLWNAQSV